MRSMRPLMPLVLLAALAAGCRARPAQVTGKITCNGQPWPLGQVLLISSDGTKHALGRIDAGGVYHVHEAPLGPVKFALKVPPEATTDHASTGPAGKPPARLGKARQRALQFQERLGALRVAARYLDPNTSGIELTIAPGLNQHDIDLTP
jgi:hypothetical protein